MAESDQKIQKNESNRSDFIKQSSDAFTREMALYDQFYEKITQHAKTHRHITLNNLEAVEERLAALKDKATNLKDSIFYHDETVIVDRQKIIAETEANVHGHNELLLDFDRFAANDLLDTIDYLNKALIQVKMNFFDTYQNSYLGMIADSDLFYSFFHEKSEEFQAVLDRHQVEVMDLFLSLDNEITHMDNELAKITQKKNRLVQTIEQFYSQEMKNFLDNQLMFSAESDYTSIDIQAIVSDKINQFNTLKSHLEDLNIKIINHLRQDYTRLHDQVLARLCKRKANAIVGSTNFFDNPEKTLTELKQEIVLADKEHDRKKLSQLVDIYLQVKDYRQLRNHCIRRTEHMLKRQKRMKNLWIREYLIESNRIIHDLEKTLLLYRSLMSHDPFLAQVIGDRSSTIIKDELNHLSLLSMNKELRTNINYDIESLNIKGKINEIEMQLIYQVKKQLLLQEVELLDLVKEIQLAMLDRKENLYCRKQEILKERYLIDRLETAMNYHLDYMHETDTINRKWNSEVLERLINDIRAKETHHIHVVDATAKVKLALKEYDIKALHFKTMYENELNYLVMQSSRVEQETMIHHEFILTTYLNQMRFSTEQIELANKEYQLRIEAIMKAVDTERGYYEDIIYNSIRKYDQRLKVLENEYQAKLYHNSHLLAETDDEKIHKILNKEIEKSQKAYQIGRTGIVAEQDDDSQIAQAKRKLRELDGHLEDALKDAQVIRDDTVAEMADQYRYAKEHYDALKPYLDQKINILDPTFYNGLESLNKRYQYKLKMAEAELDEASNQLIQDYLAVYFTSTPEIDRPAYINQANELNDARLSARNKYAEKMQKLENAFQAELDDFHNDLEQIHQATSQQKTSVIAKRDPVLQSIQIELDAIDNQYLLQQKNHQIAHQDQIRSLTDEYQTTLTSNRVLRESLRSDFAKIVTSYKPYIRLARKNRDIQDVFHRVEKLSAARYRKDRKDILAKSRKKPYL
jgi:hypothetical protein